MAEPKKRGRPPLDYDLKAARTKRTDVSKTSSDFSAKSREKFVEVVLKYFKDSNDKNDKLLSKVIKVLIKYPEKTAKTLKFAKSNNPKVTPLGKARALGIILDFNLSKFQYEGIKEKVNQCGLRIFPGYDGIVTAKNDTRPPAKSITITETMATVELQALLEHTITRIIDANEESILETMMAAKRKKDVCTLIVPWGFDGSTGQSNYKQGYKTESNKSQMDDSSLFATTLVPQRLVGKHGIIYWQNPTPQSVRFCRPIRLQFSKETPKLVLEEKRRVEEEINKLPIFPINKNGISLRIKFELCLSIIDGKILNIITNTKSTSSCPICGSSSKDFNQLCNVNGHKFKPIDGRLKHGISPTHCWIRSFEFLFTLSCKLEFEEWQARGANKQKYAEKKQLLRDRFWTDLSLRVFLPNSNGSGSSNDGNTARRAFSKFETFADILEIDVKIVKGLRTLLIALNCQRPLDVNKYNEFCQNWLRDYMDQYSWNYLTPTVHKIIIHGGQIIQASLLPVGMLGEEASEAKNKIYKKDREHHARKMSRKVTMADVFHRSIDASDPFISSISVPNRSKFKKHIPLPAEVLDLILPIMPNALPLGNDEAENFMNPLFEGDEILEAEDVNEL